MYVSLVLLGDILSVLTTSSIVNKWLSRIQYLLGVSMSTDDDLPQYIFSVCKKHVEVLEQAKLPLPLSGKQPPEDVPAPLSRRPPKCTKETSGSIGVSPDTARKRPQTKRLTSRRLDIENDMVVMNINIIIIINYY